MSVLFEDKIYFDYPADKLTDSNTDWFVIAFSNEKDNLTVQFDFNANYASSTVKIKEITQEEFMEIYDKCSQDTRQRMLNINTL